MDPFLSCHVFLYVLLGGTQPTPVRPDELTSAAVTETNPTGEGYFTSVTVRRTCLDHGFRTSFWAIYYKSLA